MDVVPQGTSKATGMDFLLAYCDVSKEDTYTIGDSYNDIPLMEYGIHGSCMECAIEDVKQHASFIYKSISEMIRNI